jgi:hypothetical protein
MWLPSENEMMALTADAQAAAKRSVDGQAADNPHTPHSVEAELWDLAFEAAFEHELDLVADGLVLF